MSIVKTAAVQMKCTTDRNENILHADSLIREAASMGARIILLPELFEREYFCQQRRYDYLDYAEPAAENLAVLHFQKLADELEIVIPVSFYERDQNVLYNSTAIIDADGTDLGVYRKVHIPDDHYYQEKFYFTPGNKGFPVWQTKYGRIGVGICWDQWFPETARCFAINGADILLFPTAIGSEPILGIDSAGHWERVMQGHAAANIVPVIAANRYGTESVAPCAENGGQSSSLVFYGSSFIADETGMIIEQAARDKDEVIISGFDFDNIQHLRLEWGLFRDRRPECYRDITKAPDTIFV